MRSAGYSVFVVVGSVVCLRAARIESDALFGSRIPEKRSATGQIFPNPPSLLPPRRPKLRNKSEAWSNISLECWSFWADY